MVNHTVSQKFHDHAAKDFEICTSNMECDASAIAFAMSMQYKGLVYTVRNNGVVQYQYKEGKML